MPSFETRIGIIGINPYVSPPASVLKKLFAEAGKDKSPLPVKGLLNGHPFIQTLVKYRGRWRLYLNTPMRKATGLKVGDLAKVELAIDADERPEPLHARLQDALSKNKKARKAYDQLIPSRQKEINRYLHFLKTEAALRKNIDKLIQSLLMTD